MSGDPKGPRDTAEPSLDDTFVRELESLLEGHDSPDSPDSPGHDLRGIELGVDQLMSESLSPVVPHTALRARLLAELPHTPRFERFAGTVAEMLDIDITAARRLLDQLDDRSRFIPALPGVELFWVDGGPRVANAMRGFVRLAAGSGFPEHEHLGEERVLVLQGTSFEPGRNHTARPGDVVVMPAGSTHYHIVPSDGPDLLVLSVVQEGMLVGDRRLSPHQLSGDRREPS